MSKIAVEINITLESDDYLLLTKLAESEKITFNKLCKEIIEDHATNMRDINGPEWVESPEKKKEYIEHWSDIRRTSMNNIVSYAHELAEKMRSKDSEKGETGA